MPERAQRGKGWQPRPYPVFTAVDRFAVAPSRETRRGIRTPNAENDGHLQHGRNPRGALLQNRAARKQPAEAPQPRPPKPTGKKRSQDSPSWHFSARQRQKRWWSPDCLGFPPMARYPGWWRFNVITIARPMAVKRRVSWVFCLAPPLLCPGLVPRQMRCGLLRSLCAILENHATGVSAHRFWFGEPGFPGHHVA